MNLQDKISSNLIALHTNARR